MGTTRRRKAVPAPARDTTITDPQIQMFDFPLRTARHQREDAAFAAPVLATPTRELAGMVRGTDDIESQHAAVTVKRTRAELQARIEQILLDEGPQTDRELEDRPEFDCYKESTVRKRRSELSQMGRVVKIGRRDKMGLWAHATRVLGKEVALYTENARRGGKSVAMEQMREAFKHAHDAENEDDAPQDAAQQEADKNDAAYESVVQRELTS